MKNNKFAWCISTFEQVDFTRQNIENCRSIYDAPVYVITTTPKLGLFRGVGADKLIEWYNAPGNNELVFGTYRNDQGYCTENIDNQVEWRKKYLPKRVFGSLGFLIKECDLNDMNSCIHIHSDSLWTSRAVLEAELDNIDKHLFIGDLSFDDESSATARKEMPYGIHFHPEGLHINIEMAYNYGFADIRYLFESLYFKYHNPHAIEALLGQWAHFCISGQNITQNSDKVDPKYYQLCFNRYTRSYHGVFPHLTNLWGMQ